MFYWDYFSYTNDASYDFVEDYITDKNIKGENFKYLKAVKDAWGQYQDDALTLDGKAEFLGIFMYMFTLGYKLDKKIAKECIEIIDALTKTKKWHLPDIKRWRKRLDGEKYLLNQYLETGEVKKKKPRPRVHLEKIDE